MSLVSVSNFLAPFRNKAQMVGLLVLAFLIFVVRWVGSNSPQSGDVSPSLLAPSQGEDTASSSLKALQLETAAFLDSQAKGSRGGNAPAALPGDESIEELLAHKAPPEAELPSEGAQPAHNRNLAEIRKKLGIE